MEGIYDFTLFLFSFISFLVFIFSEGTKTKRSELLHNIDPLTPKAGKKLYNDTFDTRVRAAIRVGDWKLITGTDGTLELYHLGIDPKEQNNLASVLPAKVVSLKLQLQLELAKITPASEVRAAAGDAQIDAALEALGYVE